MQSESDNRKLALALLQVTQMWSNPRYKPFLNRRRPGRLTGEWLSWFTGSWSVARCIQKGKKARVRKYLDNQFRKGLSLDGSGGCVDTATSRIQSQRWSSRGCFPLSLVSKVAFFLRPERFMPLDRFSIRGLNSLRNPHVKRKLTGRPYEAYLEAFDEKYADAEAQLKVALSASWVVQMAKRLGCPRTGLSSVAMRRKLFDDYPMHIGGWGGFLLRKWLMRPS